MFDLTVGEPDRPVGSNDEAKLKTLGWRKLEGGEWEAYL